MTEATTDFPFEQIQGWDQAHEALHATPPGEIARALLAWLAPIGIHRHTIRARAYAIRFVVDPGSMGNPTMAQAASIAGISRRQLQFYVLEFETFLRIYTRPTKQRRTMHPTPTPERKSI